MSNFAELFKKSRQKRYSNRRTAASAAAVTPILLTNWETGKATPTDPAALLEVCTKLGFAEEETGALQVALGWECHELTPPKIEVLPLPQTIAEPAALSIERLVNIGEGAANLNSAMHTNTSGGVDITGSKVGNVTYYDNRHFNVSSPPGNGATPTRPAPSPENDSLVGPVREYLVALQVDFDRYDVFKNLLLRTQPGSLGTKNELEIDRQRRQKRLEVFLNSDAARPGYATTPAPHPNRPEESLVDYLTQHQRITLLGAPGAGKSTALRWLVGLFGQFWREGKPESKSREQLPEGWIGCIPIFAALNRWATGQELIAFLVEEVRQYSPGLAEKLPALLEEGRVMLALDGLNELPQLQREAGSGVITDKRAAELAGLDVRYPNTACVVSCRVREFNGGPQWRDLHVLDLTPRQVEAFAASYYDEAGLVNGFISGLYGSERREKLRGLVAQPFYLLRLLDYYEIQKKQGKSDEEALPPNPAQLLKHSIEENLQQQIAQGRLDQTEAATLLKGLSRLAFNLTEARQIGVISRGKAAAWFWRVPRKIETQNKLKAGAKKQTRTERYWQLAENCGLIIQNGDGIYFYHQLFQEYFCAVYCVDHPIRVNFLERVTSLSFDEVWLLWVELDTKLIPWLITQIDPDSPFNKLTSVCSSIINILWDTNLKRLALKGIFIIFLCILLTSASTIADNLFPGASLMLTSFFISVYIFNYVLSISILLSDYTWKRRLAILIISKFDNIILNVYTLNSYSKSLNNFMKAYSAYTLRLVLIKYNKYTQDNEDVKKIANTVTEYYKLGLRFSLVNKSKFMLEQAFAYNLLGKYDASIITYTKFINSGNNSSWIFTLRGSVHFDCNNYQKALADYKQAIELDPKQGWIFGNCAKVYYEIGEYKLAIEDSTTAIGLEPTADEPHYYRGMALAATGEKERARVDLEKALELGYDAEKVRAALAGLETGDEAGSADNAAG